MKRSFPFGALLAVCLAAFGPCAYAQTASGLIIIKKPFTAKKNMDRFEATGRKRGLAIFVRNDRAAGVASVAEPLRLMGIIILVIRKATRYSWSAYRRLTLNAIEGVGMAGCG